MRFIGKNLKLVSSLILLGSLLFAQTPTGEIRLEVKDPSGAAMQVSGRIENLASGVSSAFQTDSRGAKTFENLISGLYRLEVTKAGFASQSADISVQSQAVSRTITMALAQGPRSMVDVIGITPLPGVNLTATQIAAPVQSANRHDIESSGALDLADFLNRRLSGVYFNEIQGNPLQPDLNYRGYTASPLLGTAQGVSIYMDGVRLNQPFGDVLSWDLIPRIAISETTLIPGSNPLFGLNTLGGAVSLQTKDGRSAPGTALQIGGGSFGRLTADLEHGGSNSKGLSWYLAGNLFFEDGWRADSPSNVRQFFGKLGWQGVKTSLWFTSAYANNSLIGNGLQEQRFLDRQYNSVYTKPDITANRAPFFNLSGRHSPNSRLSFSGNVYYRYIRTNTLNGDLNDDTLDQSMYQPSAAERAALTAAGYSGFPTSGENAANTPFPFWRCIGQALLRDEPGEKCNGLLNRTRTTQNNYGLSGQVALFSSPGGHQNQFTAGAAFDASGVNFLQSSELGYLNPDRSVTGVKAFGDGVTGGDVDGEPYDTRVDLKGRIRTGSVYATDTLSIGNAWHFTLSGRFNRTSITNTDRITPGGGPGSLSGHHIFQRFNPAAGVTYSPAGAVNLYFSYSEGSRAPTSIELGCADPAQPCKLPNAMAGDPPLKQVVAKTWEAGIRGGSESRLNWNLGWFRASNRDDLLFVASGQTGFGYFKNFGRTLRQGLEVGASGRIHRITLGGGYTFLDATYQSPEIVDGSSNSGNETAVEGGRGLEGLIQIQSGARIPLIPQRMLKTYASVQLTSKLSVSPGLIATSSLYARGNENNRHMQDGQYYLGPGTSPGYAIVNLAARYQIHSRVELFAQINNLLDRQYYTAAQLGATGFTSTGAFSARPFPAVSGEYPLQHATFYAPGAPRGAWGGMRFRF